MKTLISLFLFFTLHAETLFAFCGFYVAKADAGLYNKASRVVLVRNGNRMVIGMMNDFKGNLKDFAMVIPVPSVLTKEQINIGNSATFDHLDAFSAPRLVEYFDDDPCRRVYEENEKAMAVEDDAGMPSIPKNAPSHGVKVEASYTVGEYDIQILSAKYSDGLENWLIQNKYKIPKGAGEALKPYIKQQMKFFVAKVNLKEQKNTGLTFLRPIQFAFESEKFMLPIRLGMINADGPQELLVYILSKNGRVETTNYRNVFLPSNLNVPEYVKHDFKSFYTSMFDNHVKKENYRVVFTEHFWDMSWCDPCASDPLSNEQLKSLGVFWLNDGNPAVKITRLHLRYTNSTFPEDLMFQETSDVNNYQGRYVINHPWKGSPNACSEAKSYFNELPKRQELEAKNLASLTGWDINDVRKKMNINHQNIDTQKNEKWWNKIWK
jgi:hypothetical protein